MDVYDSSTPTTEAENLRQEVSKLQAHNRWLELRVKDLEKRLYGPQSERRPSPADSNNLEWEQILKDAEALAPAPTAPAPLAPASKKATLPKGPKPLDPALRAK